MACAPTQDSFGHHFNALRMCMQILVTREGCEDNQRLSKLGPGSLIEVSEVMGRG